MAYETQIQKLELFTIRLALTRRRGHWEFLNKLSKALRRWRLDTSHARNGGTVQPVQDRPNRVFSS